ncbi:MAG: SCO family protein [Mesorhizobium sp.]
MTSRLGMIGLGIAALLAAGGTGAALNALLVPAPHEEAGFTERDIQFPDVQLTDQNGMQHRLGSDIARGTLLVINFNYTTCESVCPVGNAMMQALDRQALPSLNKPVKLLSITIDPTTDTPGVIRKAASEFEPSARWLWLTGAPDDIAAVLAGVGTSIPDITLHAPLTLVGDTTSGDFYSIRALPDAGEVVELLAKLDR